MTLRKSQQLPDFEDVVQHEIDDIVNYTVYEYEQEKQEIIKRAEELNIPVYIVPGNFRRPNLIKRYAELINKFRVRCALFETVVPISMEESDLLLQSGVRRISRFIRSCPVDVVNLKLINSYVGSKLQNKIYPVLYHEFVFFLNGKKNFEEFMKNPYMYFGTCNPPQIQDNLKFAVIGPKYSNATALCERISFQYGMSIYTEKDFLHYLSTKLYNTNIGKLFRENQLKMNDFFWIECVKIFQSESANGSILYLESLTPSLAMKLSLEACGFNVVFILTPSYESFKCYWLKKEGPKYGSSSCFKEQTAKEAYNDYLEMVREYHNSYSTASMNNISIEHDNFSAWDVWLIAEKQILQTAKYNIGYETNLSRSKVVSLKNISQIFPLIPFFNKYNTLFSYYCPVCLHMEMFTKFRFDYVHVGDKFYTSEIQSILCQPFAYENQFLYKYYDIQNPYQMNDDYEPIYSKQKDLLGMFAWKTIFLSTNLSNINIYIQLST